VIRGYERDHKGKIADLNNLISEFPTSSLVPDALLEMTESYIQLHDNTSAIATYRRLVNAYPNTEQGRRGYLQMAMTQLNNGDRKGAIESYRQVVKLYPTSEEAQMAVDELKRISAEDGTLTEFTSFLASVENAPKLEVGEADQLTFEAAEKDYLTSQSTKRLQSYVEQYPDGAYRSSAWGYLMENADNNGKSSEALKYANLIIENYGDSRLAESALSVKANSEYQLGRGEDALRSWTALENRASSPAVINTARVGIMRVARDVADYQRVVDASNALLSSSTLGAEDRNEATFSRAVAYDALGKTSEARKDWSSLAGDTDDLWGAKSSYYLAENYYNGGNLDKATTQVQKLIDSATPHTYWLARGFILLSDIYAKQGKKFEAREYLRSLRENYPGTETDIFQMIDTRLNNLK
jgi:TolA-binding protein